MKEHDFAIHLVMLLFRHYLNLLTNKSLAGHFLETCGIYRLNPLLGSSEASKCYLEILYPVIANPIFNTTFTFLTQFGAE